MKQGVSSNNCIDNYAQLFIQGVPLLDLRAPIEFAQGAFPGATNLPLMNDQERHRVGKCYKQFGQSAAIELGHQLVAGKNRESRIQLWLDYARVHPDACMYCFRGGIRSQTVQAWLVDAGIVMPRIKGGYKALRRFLIDSLVSSSASMPAIIIAGRTGSGKTLLLQTLDRFIDLEKLARHRGSSFGAIIDPQPTNIEFENQVAIAMLRQMQGPDAPVFLEDEGRLIGRVSTPEALRSAMQNYPAIVLDVPLEERVDISLQAYVLELQDMYTDKLGVDAGVDAFAEHHRSGLQKISKRFGATRVAATLSLFEAALHQQRQTGLVEGYRPYIATLLNDYYDPMYDYQINQKKRPTLMRGNANEIHQWLASQPSGWWHSRAESHTDFRIA